MLNADGTMWNSHAEHDAVLPRWHGSGSRNFSEIESAADRRERRMPQRGKAGYGSLSDEQDLRHS